MRRILPLYLALLAALLTVTSCGASAQETAAAEAPAVTAAAASYPDRTEIGPAYTRAVEHLTDQGILQGYDDGTFRPAVTLTREQGAKIITYLLLGQKDADALTCDKAPYTDVAASRWSAPVIAWCTDRHILDGYGGGTFGPADQLTGRQFAKMLLCAYELGDRARYVGGGWAANVSADGGSLSLFAGDGGMDGDTPLQRQQAALMADNAQQAKDAGKTAAPAGSGASSGSASSSEGSSSPGGSASSGSSSSSGGSSSAPPSDSVETPEIEIPADVSPDTAPETETGSEAAPVTTDDNGDIILPEMP